MAPNGSNDVVEKNKTTRHPRWTRQETLILVEAKRAIEDKGQNGHRRSVLVFGDQPEPKWDLVSSYCRRRGVQRGPVQCRKRWSNLVCDFKKIRVWESQVKEGEESFWVMRNEAKRERKLPGFFDRVVYNVLDGKVLAKNESQDQLALITSSGNEMVNEEEHFEEVGQEEDGIGRENEKYGKRKIPSPVPLSEMKYQPFHQASSNQGVENGKERGPRFQGESMLQAEGVKRRRLSLDRAQTSIDLEGHVVKVLERNSDMLNTQLETQNKNNELDRENRKAQHDGLVAILSKIADAVAKIADKL